MFWEAVNELEWLWGIIVGSVIGWLSNAARNWNDRRRIKAAIRDELTANKYQITQKRDIIRQMIEALGRKKVLSGRSVPSLSLMFNTHFPSVVASYDPKERDSLHMIYGSLIALDQFLVEFEDKFKDDFSSGNLSDPWNDGVARLNNIDEKYRVTSDLIDAFLANEAIDVFHREQATTLPKS